MWAFRVLRPKCSVQIVVCVRACPAGLVCCVVLESFLLLCLLEVTVPVLMLLLLLLLILVVT